MGAVSVRVREEGYWYRCGDTYARGHAFLAGEHLPPSELSVLVDATPCERFEELVSRLVGFFAIVKRSDEAVYLAVDHVSSYPLYYSVTDGDVYVSNDAHWVRERLPNPAVDPLFEFEFLLCGVVTGIDTLYPAIKQPEAGEVTVIDASGPEVQVTRSRHFRFEHRRPHDVSESLLLDRLDAVVERAFDRLIDIADGRQLAISLTGGADSRLMACMLRRLGYDELVSFTFGLEGNWDTTVAAEVAAELQIPHEAVVYDHDMWFDWFQSDERAEYYRYAFNFDAVPPIGAVPAMSELAQSGVLDRDAIVLCGNIATSRNDYKESFRRADPRTAAELAEYFVGRYDDWGWQDDGAADALRTRVESQIEVAEEGDTAAVVAAHKDWRIRNRNATLMVTPQEYSFHGFDSWTPLWDKEFVRFWEAVPLRFRQDKRLHRTYVEELYETQTDGTGYPVDNPPNGLLKRLEGGIAGSPLEKLVGPVFERYGGTYKRMVGESRYHRHKIGTLGILSEAQYEELCPATNKGVRPFKTLEIVGCVSFEPPLNFAGPVDGRLDVERLTTAEHRARRDSLPWFAGARPLDPVADNVLPSGQ